MSSLPLLIKILPVRNIQKVMIIDRGLFVVPQVIISGGPKKETDRRHLRIEHGSPVERSDCELVVLVLAGRKGQIDVYIRRSALQAERHQKLLLRLGEFFLTQQCLSQAAMQFGILRLG